MSAEGVKEVKGINVVVSNNDYVIDITECLRSLTTCDGQPFIDSMSTSETDMIYVMMHQECNSTIHGYVYLIDGSKEENSDFYKAFSGMTALADYKTNCISEDTSDPNELSILEAPLRFAPWLFLAHRAVDAKITYPTRAISYPSKIMDKLQKSLHDQRVEDNLRSITANRTVMEALDYVARVLMNSQKVKFTSHPVDIYRFYSQGTVYANGERMKNLLSLFHSDKEKVFPDPLGYVDVFWYSSDFSICVNNNVVRPESFSPDKIDFTSKTDKDNRMKKFAYRKT